MKKLLKNNGETIAETLVALLIILLAFLMLTGAVAAAARVNEGVKNDQEAFTAFSGSGTAPVTEDFNVSVGLYRFASGTATAKSEIVTRSLHYDGEKKDPETYNHKTDKGVRYYYYD